MHDIEYTLPQTLPYDYMHDIEYTLPQTPLSLFHDRAYLPHRYIPKVRASKLTEPLDLRMFSLKP